MEPIVVEATRGGVVEARHRVHAVAVERGRLVARAGDPEPVVYLRSAAKPIQVLPLARARPDLGDEEIAVACASHLRRPEQLDAVRRLLAAAPAEERELECGPDPTPIEHMCSGKHAGFLALCRARGWESRGYRLPDHPCQREVLAEVSQAAEVPPSSVATATDGCGVVTFGLPLWRAAHAFSRLPSLDGGPRVIRALRAYPELLRGPIAADVLLTRALPGWAAKGGAEGLFCACSPDGLGIALKVEDGAFRAIRPALAAFLAALGFDVADIGQVPVTTSLGEVVGALRVRVARPLPKSRIRL